MIPLIVKSNMSNLTGLNHGTFNTLSLVDDTSGDSTEVRQLFLTGSIENTIPNNPTNTQVLNIPGLLPELNARQLIVNSYSRTEVDNIIQNNPGPKGQKGDQGAGQKGAKGSKGEGVSITGQKGDKGQQGSSGLKGDRGDLGPKGQKGSVGQNGSGQKGQKGEVGQSGQAPTNVYTKAEVDALNAVQDTNIYNNSQNIINLQVAISGLQFQDSLLQNSINNINSTLTSLQNQINAIPAPLIVESSGTQYVPKILTLQGSGIGSVGWFVAQKELVFSFQ